MTWLRVALDNNLVGLQEALRELGFRKIWVVPEFRELPKGRDPRRPWKLWKDKAIHQWLTDERIEYFLASDLRDFLAFRPRPYTVVLVPQAVLARGAEKVARVFGELSRRSPPRPDAVLSLET